MPVWVNTGRDVIDGRGALVETLAAHGVRVVTDTCVYLAPIVGAEGRVMTDSGKAAWYAPANTGVEIVFGSFEECVASAAAGRVVRDRAVWGDG